MTGAAKRQLFPEAEHSWPVLPKAGLAVGRLWKTVERATHSVGHLCHAIGTPVQPGATRKERVWNVRGTPVQAALGTSRRRFT